MTLKEYIDTRGKGFKKIHTRRILAALLYVSAATIRSWCYRGVPINRRKDLQRVTHGNITKFE